MSRATPLAESLQACMDARGYTLERLARDAKVPKPTIHHWLSGLVHKPHYWEQVLQVAAALGLRRVETNRLLRAAQLPDLDALAGHAPRVGTALFSPWRAVAPHNLPAQLTSFIGREEEVERLGLLLCDDDVRLLTLTGPGGSGKTRLALRVAQELLDVFHDGVVFIPLAAVADPDMVIPTIARVFEFSDAPGMPATERLLGYLATRDLLLVLDNVEQVAGAGPDLVALFRRAPRVKALVTSRGPLRVSGEHERMVAPFGLPGPGAPPVELARNPAARLFAARAGAVNPDFALTRRTAPAVVELCRRLDGLPLAIELAAARVRSYPPDELLTRFTGRLELAADGPRDAVARQQTLRATIAWSYDLLDARDRAIFARLAVFAGGWQAADAVAVCDVADGAGGLESLRELGLVERMTDGSHPRYRMLETIREFAVERLAESGEERATRERHARHFLAIAEAAGHYMPAVRQQDWLDRIDRDHDNARAALVWALARPEAELAARLAAALWPYWHEYSRTYEGSDLLRAVLALTNDGVGLPPSLRAGLYTGALVLAYSLSELERALTYASAALPLWESLGGGHELALVLHELGWIHYALGKLDEAILYFARSAEHWRALGFEVELAHGLDTLGFALASCGLFHKAEGPLAESARIFERLGDRLGLARSYADRGMWALLQERYDEATTLLERSVALSRETSSNFILPAALFYLGAARCFAGELDPALAALTESLDLREHNGDKLGLSLTVLGFAAVAHRQGRPERAARLSGAALALQAAQQISMAPAVQALVQRELGIVRGRLTPAEFEATLADGRAMTAAMAVAYAREVPAG